MLFASAVFSASWATGLTTSNIKKEGDTVVE